MNFASVLTADHVSWLFKGMTFSGTPAVREDILKLYAELTDCYEAQERSSPSDYTGEHEDDACKKFACKNASILFVSRVLYLSGQPGSKSQYSNHGCSISKIVSTYGINLLDFFRELNVVVSKLSAYFEARGGSSKAFIRQAKLKENSETVVVMGLLAKKYKESFNLFLHQLDYFKQIALRLGWNAFLVLRVKLLSPFPDVVSCVELLPCIFAILASHAPRLPDCLSDINTYDRAHSILKCMSDICKADFVRVQARMPSVAALLTQILMKAVPEWGAAVAKHKFPHLLDGIALERTARHDAVDLVAHPILEGLVTDNEVMQRAINVLEDEYEQHYARGGSELDERDFLSTDFTKFASPRFSPGLMNTIMGKMHFAPVPLRQGAPLGPGAHTTVPSLPATHQYWSVNAPGLFSPLPLMHLIAGPGQLNTPVSEVMGASAWLRDMTSSLPAEPSPLLQRYLAAVQMPSGGPSPAVQHLNRRVRDLVSSVMHEENMSSMLGPFPLLQPSLTAERRMEAIKLYYHSLEAILVAEEKATCMQGVSAVLSSPKFHRGLVACCVEVVAACYRMASCAFPKVLDALQIRAFDLAKIIQSFVKSVSSLPRQLKRHLFLVEEKILESLAWEPGSSLYQLIVNVHNENEADTATQSTCDGMAARRCKPVISAPGMMDDHDTVFEQGHGAIVPQPVCTPACDDGTVSTRILTQHAAAPPPSPKRSQSVVVSGLSSPVKKARSAGWTSHCKHASTERLPDCIGAPPSNALAAGCSAGALHEFCRKVLKLSAFRLSLICDSFDFRPYDRCQVHSMVYESIEYALYRQTHMFYNRHIDQVMLSAFYGFCKVHKLGQVSFREIIAQYRKQPHTHPAIFRSVVIEQSNPYLQILSRADIIAFYNQVFVPAMKTFLLKGDNCSGISRFGAQISSSTSEHVANTITSPSKFSDEGHFQSPCGGELPASAQLKRALSCGPSLPQVPENVGMLRDNRACDRIVESELLSSTSQVPSLDKNSPMVSSEGKCAVAQFCVCHHVGASNVSHKIPEGLAALLQALDTQQTLENTGEKDDR